MFSVIVIIFREVFETALVIGVLLAATKGITGRRRWISGGIALGVLGAAIFAYFTGVLSEGLEGRAQEVLNAGVLLAAAALIGWTVIWMRVYGRCMTQRLKEIGNAVAADEKPLHTLAVVAGLSALREGSEAVLFTFGVLAAGQSFWEVAAGCAVGIVLGALTGSALYLGLVKVPAKHLFSVTSLLLVFLAAGMVSQGLALLSSVGYIPELVSPLWDTSRLLPEATIVGRFFHALVGYVEKPSGVQALGYFLTLAVIFSVSGLLNRAQARTNALSSKEI